MSSKVKLRQSGNCLYLCYRRETFSEGDSILIVEDRINLFLPWRSQRVLKVDGTGVLYSAVPLSSSSHRLLCYTYCADAMKRRNPGFYRHVLVLGCGGGALPRWLLSEYPALRVDIVDVSPKIISVCKKYFLQRWEGSGRLKYICADAGEYEEREYRYQFIFCDLFDGETLAPIVFDRDFAGKLRGMLCEGGFLIVNCGWGQLDAVREVYRDVFEKVKIVSGESGQTEVLLAYNS